MAKKKFSETRIGKILVGAAAVVSPTLSSLLSGSLSVGEALNEIKKSDISPEEKAKLEQLYIQERITEDQEITKRWTNDNDAGVLTRSIRPVTCALLTLMMLAFTFLDSSESIGFVVEEKWVTFWGTAYVVVIGAYFGSKGMEKTFRK